MISLNDGTDGGVIGGAIGFCGVLSIEPATMISASPKKQPGNSKREGDQWVEHNFSMLWKFLLTVREHSVHQHSFICFHHPVPNPGSMTVKYNTEKTAASNPQTGQLKSFLNGDTGSHFTIQFLVPDFLNAHVNGKKCNDHDYVLTSMPIMPLPAFCRPSNSNPGRRGRTPCR
jgi:hypothetical protein